jgi:hypothetical protein
VFSGFPSFILVLAILKLGDPFRSKLLVSLDLIHRSGMKPVIGKIGRGFDAWVDCAVVEFGHGLMKILGLS